MNAGEVSADKNVAKISIVGVGMRSHSGVAHKMFAALAKEKINIDMISTSEIKISCVIAKDKARRAVQLIHSMFNLGKKGTQKRAKKAVKKDR